MPKCERPDCTGSHNPRKRPLCPRVQQKYNEYQRRYDQTAAGMLTIMRHKAKEREVRRAATLAD